MKKKISRITNEPIPSELFKYRDWNNRYHKRLIAKCEIYLPKPSDFNDPFDGNIQIRWDKMTYQDCLQKSLEFINIINVYKNQKQVIAYAKKVTDDKTLWHPEKLNKERPELIEKWDSIIGLFSLSEIRDSILMWSNYASNHTGFVAGLSGPALANNYGFDYFEPIHYQKDYPFIDGNEDNTSQFHKKFFYKSNDWKYEKEWRLSKNHILNRKIQIEPESITQIIIGCKMDNKSIKDLTKKSKRYLGDKIPIFKANKHEEGFKLDLDKIN